MTGFRALCAELLQLDDEQPAEYADWKRRWNACTARARAALNTPPLAPIPVSERLPGADDMKDGHCWFWSPGDECWFWERPDSDFVRHYGEDFLWLPHWAIPLPEESK